MYNLNQQLHFVGIGGVGMSGIAEVLLNLGYSISGSDLRENALISNLRELGAKISIGHRSENVSGASDVVIVSSAIRDDNPELCEAKRRSIPVIARAEMLAELMRMKYGVAVAGSHGKTTTTSMCAKVLQDIGLDPTVIIGGRVLTQQSGARVGTGQYLVAEADESDGSFCLLRPAIAVVTNIDTEHLSYYGSFGALEDAFLSFMRSVPFYGLVVACGDDPIISRLLPRLERRIITYGFSSEYDVHASDIDLSGPISEFTLHVQGEEIGRFKLPMSGRHMVSNSLAALSVAVELGGYSEEVCQSLETFPGVSRRTEVLCDHGGLLVIDDYAHHPTEIATTLRALKTAWLPYLQKKLDNENLGRLIVLFEPHRYSRTKELFAKFLTAFSDADKLYVSDIYPAGEVAIEGITGEFLARSIQHERVVFHAEPAEAFPEMIPELKSGDIVVTLGAGSICKSARELCRIIKDR